MLIPQASHLQLQFAASLLLLVALFLLLFVLFSLSPFHDYISGRLARHMFSLLS